MPTEVEAWLEAYENPMKEVVVAARAVILAADVRVNECIKWLAPTFTYKGNLASFNPRSKSRASLMFHKGALIPGEFPNLEGDGKEARSMKFESVSAVEAKSAELGSIVRAWCDLQDSN